MKPFFARLGGKTRLCKKIVEMIPDHKLYVEPFIGAGSVFLRKRRSHVEVINDLDKDIYDMWNDLLKLKRSDLDKMDMKADREKFLEMREHPEKYSGSVYERFYRNIYLSKNSFSQNRRTYGTYLEKHPVNINYLKETIGDFQNRLNGVSIKNKDYKEVVLEFDGPDTFFYLDPPYSNAEKGWNYVSTIQPNELLAVLRKIKGKFIMSYDDCETNRELFKEFKISVVPLVYRFHKNKKTTTELLIQNF
jgi:DNA adenine methylase